MFFRNVQLVGVLAPLWFASLLLAVTLSGCATSTTTATDGDPLLKRLMARSCSRPGLLIDQSRSNSGDPPVEHGPRPESASRLSPRALRIASVMSASDPLERVALLSATARSGDQMTQTAMLLARQDLTERTMLTMMEVSSVLSELHCENEKGDLIQRRLDAQIGKQQRKWTVASVVTGALTSLVSGGMGLSQMDTQANVVNVLGGVMSTVTGLGAMNDSASISYRPNTQLLSDIYSNPDRSDAYPWTVWKFLTRRPVGLASATGQTVREALIEQWREAGLLGIAGSETERRRIALVEGQDGTYNSDDLSARNEMLDLLEAAISSMNQDISFLLHELNQIGLVNSSR